MCNEYNIIFINRTSCYMLDTTVKVKSHCKEKKNGTAFCVFVDDIDCGEYIITLQLFCAYIV